MGSLRTMMGRWVQWNALLVCNKRVCVVERKRIGSWSVVAERKREGAGWQTSLTAFSS
jgi:hypothetical protein